MDRTFNGLYYQLQPESWNYSSPGRSSWNRSLAKLGKNRAVYKDSEQRFEQEDFNASCEQKLNNNLKINLGIQCQIPLRSYHLTLDP